jgi:hypothetical protein
MAVLPPKGRTVDRRPSLRGKVMQDVSQGVERNRAWPPKRKKNLPEVTKDQNDLFRQYQWATKYWPPKLYIQAMQAVKGTPLLPRDLMTMIMANRLAVITMEDGTRKFPMTAVQDVSASLDAITQIEGQSIRRGSDYWEGFTPGGGGGEWTLIGVEEITSPVPSVDFIDLAGANQIIIIGRLLTASASTWRKAQVSIDNGANYFDGASDYFGVAASGQETARDNIFEHTGGTVAARTMGGLILNAAITGVPKLGLPINAMAPQYFNASLEPINAVRIKALSGNLTGGTVYCLIA